LIFEDTVTLASALLDESWLGIGVVLDGLEVLDLIPALNVGHLEVDMAGRDVAIEIDSQIHKADLIGGSVRAGVVHYLVSVLRVVSCHG
jgi:hypothetical protein